MGPSYPLLYHFVLRQVIYTCIKSKYKDEKNENLTIFYFVMTGVTYPSQ